MAPQSQAAPLSEQVAAFFEKHRTGLVTLVFTDLVDSTALLRQMGDQAGTTFLRRRREIVRETLRALPGAEEIETAGDSFLLVFAKPSDAVRFALLTQARLRTFSSESRLPVQERIGIHLGEVVIAEHETEVKTKDLYGIQLATCARVMALAQGGQILLTRGVFDSARAVLKGEDIAGVGSLFWVSHGPYLLKGLEEAVEVCEVGEAGQGPLTAPKTTEKAQRQVRPDEEPVLGWRPAVGQEVPNTPWILEEKLGEGGFGEVWVAQHPKLKERRVFKFCFRADRVRALKRELTLFRLLKEHVGDHPNIVRLHEVYLEEPPFYLEEEYVEGKDLRRWCEGQGGVAKVPLETRLEMVAQAAEALQAAHDAGIIHRDVKPGNILISNPKSEIRNPKAEPGASLPLTDSQPSARNPQAVVKLTDFGIGQVISAEYLKGVTQAGFTQTMLGSTSSGTGTTMYLAPEIVAGMPATTRSDIYSLGVVLLQLLVGDFRHPLTTDWSRRVPDSLLREDLELCFAGDPAERFSGARQLAQNLRSLAERRARREEGLRLARHAAQRHRVAVLSCVVAAALLLLAGALGYGLWRAQQARGFTEANVYAADMNLAQQALLADDLGKARLLLNCYGPGSGREHLRGFEWRYLTDETRTDYSAKVLASDAPAFRMALDAGGRTLAIGRWDGTIELWDPGSLQRTLIFDQKAAGVAVVACSPQGRLLAASGPKGVVRLWQMEPPRLVGELAHTNNAICLGFSPDGKRLASFHVDSGICLWDLPTFQVERRYPDFPNRGVHGGPVCFSPDGRYLAAGDRLGRLRVIDWAADRVVVDIVAHEQPLMCLAYAPDGKLLASGSGYSVDDIRLWNPSTGEKAGSLAGHGGWVSALEFSKDGRHLYSSGADQTLAVWDVPGRRLIRKLRGHEDEVFGMVLDSSRTNLISGCRDGSVAKWDLASSQRSSVRYDFPDKVWCPAFVEDGSAVAALDPDGAVVLWRLGELPRSQRLTALGTSNVTLTAATGRGLLACATRTGSVRIWSVRSASVLTNLSEHSGWVSGLRFSPNENWLLAFDFSGASTVWDASTWIKRSALNAGDRVAAAAVSSDGNLLLTGTWEGSVSWWDMATAQRLTESKAHRFVISGLVFSPDGSTVASSSHDGAVALWEVASRRETAHWRAARNAVHAVSFSPDGTRLVTGLSGGYAGRLWDLKTRRELMTLAGRGNMFYRVEFQSGGGAVLCGSEDGYCHVWMPPSLADLDALPRKPAEERPRPLSN